MIGQYSLIVSKSNILALVNWYLENISFNKLGLFHLNLQLCRSSYRF